MSQTSTTRVENRDDRVFSTPIALAFVRIATARRGISEAEARKRYLEYFRGSPPAPIEAARVSA